jgi:hypothetical protein
LGTDAKKLFDHRLSKEKESKNVDMGKIRRHAEENKRKFRQ